MKKLSDYFVSPMIALAKRRCIVYFLLWFLICLYSANVNTEEKKEEDEERTRWLLVAEKIEEDLLRAYAQAKKGMEVHYHVDNGKLRLVARFGKVLFYR